MQLTFKQAREVIIQDMAVQLDRANKGKNPVLSIPMLVGPVGIGKTELVRDVTAELGMSELLEINCGDNSDPTDVAGMPVPSKDGSDELVYQITPDAAKACKSEITLFFDDVDKAPPGVQVALIGILGKRMFRQKRIVNGTVLVLAGNRVGDDVYSNELSESLRTRVTVIEMKADLKDFCEYGANTGDIDPCVIGYLQYKPEHLHLPSRGAHRFPTPRSWYEASATMGMYKEPDKIVGGMPNWKSIVARKCGEEVGNDFWAWFSIIAKINVKEILKTGAVAQQATDQRMSMYATVFAVASYLNRNGVEPEYKGLSTYLKGLEPEMRVAFLVQLQPRARDRIASLFPDAAGALMSILVKGSST